MERRQIQSEIIPWVLTLSPTEKEELAKKDRPRGERRE